MKGPLYLPSEEAMTQLAGAAAAALCQCPGTVVVYLRGNLGVGKTTFARGMIKALGEEGPVRSPSYGLIAEYSLPIGRIVHLDLYRLRDDSELEQLGIRDYLPDSRLWLVEWPDKVQRGLPAADVVLRLEVEGAGRTVSMEPASTVGTLWTECISRSQFS
jgi:tRNA threonylcarbamoyladenosine biosynthesis protein TsaE